MSILILGICNLRITKYIRNYHTRWIEIPQHLCSYIAHNSVSCKRSVKIVSLVVRKHKGGEVPHFDKAHRFHAQFGEVKHFGR